MASTKLFLALLGFYVLVPKIYTLSSTINVTTYQNKSSLLPILHILRVSSNAGVDVGCQAALGIFHTSSKWNDRFQIQLHNHNVSRELFGSVGPTLRAVLQALTKEHIPYVAMIGPDSSAENIPVAQITPIYSLVSIALTDSVAFSNTSNYPLFFRGVPRNVDFQQAAISLLNTLGVPRVVAVAINEAYAFDRIISFAEKFDSQPNSSVDRVVFIKNPLDVRGDARRIIGPVAGTVDYVIATTSIVLPYLACEIYLASVAELGQNASSFASPMPFPAIITLDVDVRDNWREVPGATLNCTKSQMGYSSNNSISVQETNPFYGSSFKSYLTVNNVGIGDFHASFEGVDVLTAMNDVQRKLFNNTDMVQAVSYFAFDASWALFTALYRADKQLERVYGMRASDLSFFSTNAAASTNSDVVRETFVELLHDELLNTSFTGVTRKFKFDKNQNRLGIVDILGYAPYYDVNNGGILVEQFNLIGYYDAESEKLSINQSLLHFSTPTDEPPHVWRRRWLLQREQQRQLLLSKNGATEGLSTELVIVIAVIGAVAFLSGVFVVAFWQYRRYTRVTRQKNLLWLVPYHKIQVFSKDMGSEASEIQGGQLNPRINRQRPIQPKSNWTVNLTNGVSSENTVESIVATSKKPQYYVGSGRVHLRLLLNFEITQHTLNFSALELNRTFSTAIAMKKLAHDNVNRFVGICLDFPREMWTVDGLPQVSPLSKHSYVPICIMDYCEKGSLRNMLQNSDFVIEKDLKVSFIADCARGLRELHSNPTAEVESKTSTQGVVHGFLHTGNVMLDSKLTCKITDYGLLKWGRTNDSFEPVNIETILENEQNSTNDYSARKKLRQQLLKMVFRPPEQLRDGYDNCNDLKQSDVFSVGVVMAEILTREEPTFVEQQSSSTKNTRQQSQQQHLPVIISDHLQIIKRQIAVANGILGPITPYIDDTIHGGPCHPQLRTLIADCCNGVRAEQRPKIEDVYGTLSQLPDFAGGSSIVERLVTRLQHYTDGLEALIAERTSAVLEASQQSEQLLLQLLPGPVAAELKAGRHVAPEAFDCVSIYFSDIVGFTALSSRLSPMQVVQVLNALYTGLDVIVEKRHVYKMETIGDAFMVVSGVPQRIGNKHASDICEFALDALATLQVFRLPHIGHGLETPGMLRMRTGLHCGPVLAGVVGIKMPRYCLFGNTVIVANEMESSGEALKIHASSLFYNFVQEHDRESYTWQTRNVRGRSGFVSNGAETYWLTGRRVITKQRD